MLRMVMCARRRTLPSSSSGSSTEHDDGDEEDGHPQLLESWPDFLRRTAQWTDEQLGKAGLNNWVATWRSRKWKWAAQVAAESNRKWSAVATRWQPLLHSKCQCGRRQARPKKRWDQDFVEYLERALPGDARPWHELARDAQWWLQQTEKC